MPRISSCRLYFLPGAEEPKGGWGLAGKVSSALPRPEPSISPQLTCETQGWEPQHYSVTKSRFIGT